MANVVPRETSLYQETFQEQHPDAIFYNSTTKRYELRKEPREIVTPDQSH